MTVTIKMSEFVSITKMVLNNKLYIQTNILIYVVTANVLRCELSENPVPNNKTNISSMKTSRKKSDKYIIQRI